jgi:hypothetical protein
MLSGKETETNVQLQILHKYAAQILGRSPVNLGKDIIQIL